MASSALSHHGLSCGRTSSSKASQAMTQMDDEKEKWSGFVKTFDFERRNTCIF
jgi:hypothetical protein